MHALKKFISFAPSPLADRSPERNKRPPLILKPNYSMAGSREKLQDLKSMTKKLSPPSYLQSSNRNLNSINLSKITGRKDVSASSKQLDSTTKHIDAPPKSKFVLKDSMNSSKFIAFKENIRPYSPQRESFLNLNIHPGTTKHRTSKPSQLFLNDVSNKLGPMSPMIKIQKEQLNYSKLRIMAQHPSVIAAFTAKGNRASSKEMGLANDKQITSQFSKSRAYMKLDKIMPMKSRSIGEKKMSNPDSRMPENHNTLTRSTDCKPVKKFVVMDKRIDSTSLRRLNLHHSTVNKKPENPLIEELKNRIDNNEELKGIVSSIKEAFKNWQPGDLSDNSGFKTQIGFYRIHRQVGKGCFGVVYLATQRLTGMSVALKTIPKSSLTHADAAVKIDKEVLILKRINNHPSVIRLFEVFEDANNVYMVFELLEQGDLAQFFKSEPLFSEQKLKPFFHKIVKGVEYLHRNGVVHRDIKLDNILLDRNLRPKLCDFGISSLIIPGQRIFDTGGTPAYLAPEVIKAEGKVGPKSDVWSLGILLYLLSFGTVPFKANDMQVLYKKIIIGVYSFPEVHIVSSELIDLIKRLLVVDVAKRPDVEEMLRHPWFHGVKNASEKKAKNCAFLLESNAEEIMGFLTHIGFPAAYVELSRSQGLFNHVKACMDSLSEKLEAVS